MFPFSCVAVCTCWIMLHDCIRFRRSAAIASSGLFTWMLKSPSTIKWFVHVDLSIVQGSNIFQKLSSRGCVFT